MTHSDNQVSDMRMHQPGSGIDSVKDDMAAIFGSKQRADAKPPLSRAMPAKRKVSRTPLYAALSVCGVATMLVAGVVGGQSVLIVAPAKSERSGPMPAVKQAPAIPSTSMAAVSPTQSRPVMSAGFPAQLDVSTPSLPSIPTTEAAFPLKAPTSNVSIVRTNRGTGPVPAVLAQHLDQTAASSGDRLKQASAPVLRADCLTVSDCLEFQLRAGENGVARAYETATIAGVRPKTLREYQAEWIRARAVAIKQPQEAIRIYGMIRSDLRLLAADPTLD